MKMGALVSRILSKQDRPRLQRAGTPLLAGRNKGIFSPNSSTYLQSGLSLGLGLVLGMAAITAPSQASEPASPVLTMPNASSSELATPLVSPPVTQPTDGANSDVTVKTQNKTQAPEVSRPSSEPQIDQDKRVAIQSRPNSNILGPLKPFLLHSKDATITYLMPGAIVNHQFLAFALRSELEDRALKFWTLARGEKDNLSTFSDNPFLLRSRVEDRFQSEHYTSLYWKEERQTGKDVSSQSIHTLTYDHTSKQTIGLKDLFGRDDEGSYQALLDLLTAYIRVDVARQKSLRLGASVTPDQDAWLKNFVPLEENLSGFNLSPSTESGLIAGLTFHFNPGLLGAEADGPYSVYVPSSIFTSSLTPDFAANFGGDALKISNHASNGLSSAMLHLRDMKAGDELAGAVSLEGEIPQNWCNGLHVTLLDGETIISEGAVTLEPALPDFGLVEGMLRFRVDMSVAGEGGKSGRLVFEPYKVEQNNGEAVLQNGHACDVKQPLVLPDPIKDQISVPVIF